MGFELKYQGDVNIIQDRLMNILNMEICAIDPYISKNQYTEEKRLQNVKCKLKLQAGTKFYNCVDKFRNIFMAGKWDIGKTTLVKHEIKTVGEKLLKKPRRQPAHLAKHIDEAIMNLENHGIIEKCSSPWNTQMVCVRKKEKREIRL